MTTFRLLLVFAVVSSGSVAKATTIAELFAAYSSLNTLLQNTLATAGAEGRSVAGVAGASLDRAVADLRQLVKEDVHRDISTLTGAALTLARTIEGSVSALNALLNERITCGIEGSEYLIAGVQTVASQLQTALPFVKDAKPFLYGFKFDGHYWAVVPRQGGRMMVRGYGIWNGNQGPLAKLVNTDGSTIRNLTPERAQSDDAVALRIDADVIGKTSGSCPLIEVTPQKKKRFGGIEQGAPMRLPICVPKTLDAKIWFEAKGSYQVSRESGEKALNPVVLHCSNDSCEHRTDCSRKRVWSLDAGCRVVRLQEGRGNNYWGDGHSMRVGFSESGTVTAEGTIDDATCINLGLGTRRTHSAVWEWVVTPIVQCKHEDWVNAGNKSAEWSLTDSAPHCVTIDRPDPNAVSAWSSSIWVRYGQDEPMKILDFPATSPLTNPESRAITISGATVKAEYTPVAGGGKSQACVTVTVPKCGY